MTDRRSSDHVGFERWARIAAAVVAGVLLTFGVLAVFKTDGGAASTALLVVGGVLGYIALANDRIREVTTSGVSFFERESAEVIEEALTSPDTPPAVQQYVADRFESHVRSLPTDVRREVTEVTTRSKRELLAELCDELGIEQLPLGVGSTLPARVFRESAAAVGVSDTGSMPDVAGRIVESMGGVWADSDWSRGSTVTSSGLRKVLEAVRASRNR